MADHDLGHQLGHQLGHEQAYADQARRYRLEERIASGGMGHVWRGTDTILDRRVAIKLLRHEYADDAVFRSRFETEAQHAAGLRHPGVAQVFDFGGTHGGTPYLVMEYVDGQPLSSLLRPGQAMDPDAAAGLLAAAGDAIGAAHAQGIVHRDVKPANLLVTDDRRVKITDFGIARAADAVALTRVGEVLGTPQYLSPEQADSGIATPASDVYSLGVVAFECLAGRRPFDAASPVATALAHLHEPVPELPAGVPPALADVVRRALAKDPAARYPDGSAFADAVRAAMTVPAAAGPTPTMVLTAPVPLATPAVAPSVARAAQPAAQPAALHGVRSAADAWRERARQVPVPLWAAAGAFVVVLAVAALANAGGSGGSPSGTTSTDRGPTTGASAATATASTTSTTPTASAPAPTKPAPPAHQPPGHGPKKPPTHHGHQGKGHQ